MPSRLSLRLGQLPHNALAELAARLCSESPALQAAADECMAAHNPLDHEMVERVLLSPDLVPHILGPLGLEDGAAAVVCSQWLTGWSATNAPRRRLKQVPLDFPEAIGNCAGLQMAGTPDGRLVVRTCTGMHILDRSMRVLQTVATARIAANGVIAADNDSIFGGTGATRPMCRSTHDGKAVAQYEVELGSHNTSPVLAPGGLLFCVMRGAILGVQVDPDEIIALDAQTLQLRHRFGLGLLRETSQMAVVRDELYVCDTGNHRLQVFSLTGEHRRSITGEWREPEKLCFAKDRLYLVERELWREEDTDEDVAAPVKGRRILVLSLQGDILQVFTHPAEPTAVFTSICCFDHKLLASYEYTESAGTRSWKCGVLPLQGL